MKPSDFQELLFGIFTPMTGTQTMIVVLAIVILYYAHKFRKDKQDYKEKIETMKLLKW